MQIVAEHIFFDGAVRQAERCEIIIPREGYMRYKISKRPIKIIEKTTGSVTYGYHITEIDPNGNSLTKYPKKKRLGKDYNTAVKKLAAIKLEKANQGGLAKYILAITFLEEYIEELTLLLEGNQISKFHFDSSKRYIERFIEFLKKIFNRPLLASEITTIDIDRFLGNKDKRFSKRKNKKVDFVDGQYSKRAARQALKTAFEFAKRYKYVEINPVINARGYKLKKTEPDPFTLDQFERLINAMPSHTFENRTRRNTILLTAYLGTRGITTGSILLSDLVCEDGEQVVILRKNKDNEIYAFPLLGLAEFACQDQIINLEEYFGDLPKDLPLFPNSNGKMMISSTRSHWISDAIKKYFSGDPEFTGKSFKSLRSFAGTEISYKVDPENARLVLMHKDVSTTKKFYIKKNKKVEYNKRKSALANIPQITIKVSEVYEEKEIKSKMIDREGKLKMNSSIKTSGKKFEHNHYDAQTVRSTTSVGMQFNYTFNSDNKKYL